MSSNKNDDRKIKGLFKAVVEGLSDYYSVLKLQGYVKRLLAHALNVGYLTGNNQSDYERLRDQSEAMLREDDLREYRVTVQQSLYLPSDNFRYIQGGYIVDGNETFYEIRLPDGRVLRPKIVFELSQSATTGKPTILKPAQLDELSVYLKGVSVAEIEEI